jgi:hypothetical protein
VFLGAEPVAPADAGGASVCELRASGPARLRWSFAIMKLRQAIPISKDHDSPIFEALAVQVIIAILSLMILDGGQVAQICGVALVAFWGGVSVLIYRRPHTPSRTDLQVIRFGYLPVVVLAFVLVNWAWHLRGLR